MEMENLLDFSLDVGRELLESGAETSRVEDTLKRIIGHFYKGRSEIFVVMTGFFVSIGTCTAAVRVQRRAINLSRVSDINMMSRDIVDSKISFQAAVERLKAIQHKPPYPLWLKTIAVAVCCGVFTLLQSGGFADGLNSFIVGAALNILLRVLRKYHTADFIVTFTGGVSIAVLTVVMYMAGLGENINVMITGAIMPLVPGLAITNAIRDIIAGDYLSGSARMFDATVVAVALAAGAGSVMYVIGYLSGGKLV